MNKNLHQIDQYFKEGIEGRQEEPDDKIWAALESQLDKRDLFQTQFKYRLLRNAVAAFLILGVATAAGYHYYMDQHALVAADTKKIKSTIKNESSLVGATEQSLPAITKTHSLVSAAAIENGDRKIAIHSSDQLKISRPVTLKIEQQLGSSDQDGNGGSKITRATSSQINSTASQRTSESTPDIALASTENTVQTKASQTLLSSKAISSNESVLVAEKVEGSQQRISEKLLLSRSIISLPTSAAIVVNPAKNVAVVTSPYAKKPTSNGAKRFSVATLMMPEIAMNALREGRHEHHEDDRTKIEQGERVNSSFVYGVQAGWDLSKKITVFSGYLQSTTQTTVEQQEIYARPRRERPGQAPSNDNSFKLNCSAGYAYVTSKTATTVPLFGDSLKGLPSTTSIKYAVIPVGIKYNLGVGKLSFSAVAGFNLHLLSGASLQANFLEPTGAKSTETVTIQGVKKSYISGLFGVAVNYKLTPSLRWFVSPLGTIGISTINQNTPASTRRSSLGLQTGIAVSF